MVFNDSHLRIKEASVWFNDTDCFIESLKRKSCARSVRYHGSEVQLKVLGKQLGHKTVTNAFLLPGWYFHIVSCGCQVPQ